MKGNKTLRIPANTQNNKKDTLQWVSIRSTRKKSTSKSKEYI